MFFFFQAEDGIRDYKVTGVQTCALPICQTIVIDNRPGASGSVGTAAFIKSQPDGYSLSMFGMPALLAPMLFNNNLYDVRKDFLPVATVYDLPMAIVINPRELPDVTNLQQLIEHARKAKPALNYTSSGTGSRSEE